GWRVQIRKRPLLTQVGAWRPSRNPQPVPGEGPYGGFYTQDQVREIVSYARNLHIQVIPEIEMPGHCTAALASYSKLGCQN
ncbi:family 20 glycosylhydrolase, partial [Acinetobacter baumannii]